MLVNADLLLEPKSHIIGTYSNAHKKSVLLLEQIHYHPAVVRQKGTEAMQSFTLQK